MSLESLIVQALGPLVQDRVYPDVEPGAVTPYITYQQVGGDNVSFLSDATDGQPRKASQKNARLQVNVWGLSRVQVNALARDAQDVLELPPVRAVTLGAFTAEYEEDTKLRGTRQDFSVWYED